MFGFIKLAIYIPSVPHIYTIQTLADNFTGERLPRLYKAIEKTSLERGALSPLTASYMQNIYLQSCLSRYRGLKLNCVYLIYLECFSYVGLFSGNMGSVQSAKHGIYKGTLIGPTHLDIINWTNRLKRVIMGQ